MRIKEEEENKQKSVSIVWIVDNYFKVIIRRRTAEAPSFHASNVILSFLRYSLAS